ncbi:MAG: AAA family ATPase [Gemmatimonadota bacterium]|nr:AAA family ATPase [Gemmatimonadota bacterium]
MVRLRTLGQCVVEIGETKFGPEAELLFALVLYLAMEGGKRTGRGVLTTLLWPEVPEEKGAHCLRQAAYRLRSLGVPICSDRSHVWLDPAGVEADFFPVQHMQEGAERERLAESVPGSFLPGYSPNFSAPFAEWVDRQRDIINSGVRRVLVGAVTTKRARGDWRQVEWLSAKCLAIDPLNEEATLASAEAAALQGGKVQALTILDRYLREIGPEAREIRLPATMLRRRIAEAPYLDRDGPVLDAPFVGRTEEMAILNRALQLAHGAHGSAHVIWGEPGIGKSRLVTEFCRAASLQRVQIVRVGNQSHDERRPLSAFSDMTPKLLMVPGALGCAPESMKYLRRLYEHNPNETLPSPDTSEAAILYSKVRRSVLDLLDAIASEGCLIVVIEDVQWLDAISWDVMLEAVPWLASRRLLLVMTSRVPNAEQIKGVAQLAGLQRHHLGPLPDESVRALVGALLSRTSRPVRPELADWCAANGGGNPYYLSELVVHGLRAGPELQIPASLTTLIRERLARLHPISLRVLQACAILGKHSTIDRLETVLEERRVDLLDGLDELEVYGLVSSAGARVFSKHEILSQAALERISAPSRRLLHHHAAMLLEREVMEAQSAPMLWDSAEHWQLAGERERAVRLLRWCARHALEIGVPAEAGALLEKAVTLTVTPAERRDVLGELTEALRRGGQWERLLPVLEEIKEIRAQHDPAHDGHDDFELMEYQGIWKCGGAMPPILASIVSCVESRRGNAEHKVKAATIGLTICDNLCDDETARTLFQSVSPRARDFEVDRLIRLDLELVYHTTFGSYHDAVIAGRDLVADARRSKSVIQRAELLFHASIALRGGNELEEAVSAATEAYTLAKKFSLAGLAASIATSTAWTYLSTDDIPESVRWCERAEAWLPQISDRAALANTLVTRAHLAFLSGEFAAADQFFDASINASRRTTHPRLLVKNMALRLHIRLARLGQPPSQSEVGELIGLHAITRRASGMDHTVASIHALVATCGDLTVADRLVGSYLQEHRRELQPPVRALRDIAARTEEAKRRASVPATSMIPVPLIVALDQAPTARR